MNKHRKETMNSVHFEKLGEDRYLIRVSEFYPDNCCEEDETIVTEEHLDWLLTFKDDDIREQDQDDDNRAIGICQRYAMSLTSRYISSKQTMKMRRYVSDQWTSS